MSAYGAILSARFRTLLQYRAAAVAGIVTQFAFGFIHIMVLSAFYRSSDTQQPMALSDVVTYVWLGQAFFAMLPWSVDSEVRTMVRSGAVVYELVRPLNLYWLWFTRMLAMRTAPTLLRSLPLMAVTGLFFGLGAPPSWASALAWVLSLLGALLMGCAISCLLAISLFWTISGQGLSSLLTPAIFVFSGMLVPLPLLPDWAQPLLNAMPFRGLVDVPFRLYTGHIPPSEALSLFGFQMAWAVALVLLGHRILARGTRRLVVQGG